MNTEEKTMILELADRIGSTPVANKDPDAEKLIQERIASHKDAAYVMTQALLIQQQALTNLQNRVRQLEQQVQTASQQKKGFFGNLFGGGQSGFSRQRQQQNYGNPGYSNNVAPGPGGYQGSLGQQPGYGSGFGQPQYGARGGSSFLGSAMSTAVGVAGGMALFSGIEHLMGAGRGPSVTEVIGEPGAGTDSFLGGGDSFQGQDNLLDQGFGPSGDMSDMSSGFDGSDLGGGFDDSDFGSW